MAWNPLVTEPPFPGMHLDTGLCRWIPDDIEDFAAKHGAEFDEVVSKYKNDFGTPKANLPRRENQKNLRCNRNISVLLHRVNRHSQGCQKPQQPRYISLPNRIIQPQKRQMKSRLQPHKGMCLFRNPNPYISPNLPSVRPWNNRRNHGSVPRRWMPTLTNCAVSLSTRQARREEARVSSVGSP